jgi:hypothetical protein
METVPPDMMKSIKAIGQPYQDTGLFYVQAGLDKTRIKKAIKPSR